MIGIPNIGDCKVYERTRDYGNIFTVALTYYVPNGPTFDAYADIGTYRFLPSESLRMRRETARDALSNLRKKVRAHLDVVLPVDNSPDDRVAYSEALTRLRLAHETCFEDVRRGGPVDDIGAAISRIAALPIPQSNYE